MLDVTGDGPSRTIEPPKNFRSITLVPWHNFAMTCIRMDTEIAGLVLLAGTSQEKTAAASLFRRLVQDILDVAWVAFKPHTFIAGEETIYGRCTCMESTVLGQPSVRSSGYLPPLEPFHLPEVAGSFLWTGFSCLGYHSMDNLTISRLVTFLFPVPSWRLASNSNQNT